MSHVVFSAESAQYIGWFQRCRGACTAAGKGNVLECHQERLTLHVGKREVDTACTTSHGLSLSHRLAARAMAYQDRTSRDRHSAQHAQPAIGCHPQDASTAC